ncbi:MAG: HEAT repeat domain-containing protein [Planctomycetales bacterium]|nr:HEAT repeat domain-containing protein [Planctomycetales bacterium]
MSAPAPENDTRSVAELVLVALGDADENTAWDAVSALHWRGTKEVLEAAQELCRSACQRERKLGCDILGQIGIPDRTFPEDCVGTLLDMLACEANSAVLRSIFIAFSHLADERGAAAATAYAKYDDPAVRRAVVLALGSSDSEATIASLLSLSTDADSNVRDWATFPLAQQTEADSSAIRDALAARLADVDADTRGEALVGLANRGDSRAIAAIFNYPAAFENTSHIGLAKSVLEEKGLL